jgi:hypothetical protein
MPYRNVRHCPICSKNSLKDLSTHLRQRHKLSVKERHEYLAEAKRTINSSKTTKSVNSRSISSSSSELDNSDSDIASRKNEETEEIEEEEEHKEVGESDHDDTFTQEGKLYKDDQDFLPILRKMLAMNMEQKRWYIKYNAPDDFIRFLRGISLNCDKFKLNFDHYWAINYSNTFRAITTKTIPPRRIPKFMTRKDFLQPLTVLLPQIIRVISL